MIFSDLTLAAAVICYCLLHSVMADPDIMRSVYDSWWYRFFYVTASCVLILPVVYIYLKVPKQPFFDPSEPVKAVLYAMWLGALAFGAYASRSYDNSQFLGFQQLKDRLNGGVSEKSEKKLSKKGALSIVRHPYYSASFVLIWARPMNREERKLMKESGSYDYVHSDSVFRRRNIQLGAAYAQYQKEVPALIPRIRLRHGK